MTIQEQLLDDLDAVFDDGLTLSITHTYNGGASQETLKVFFDRSYEAAFPEGSVESANISILVKSSDAGNITRDSTFTVSGTTYYPIENQGDEQGVTRIFLSEDQI